MDLGKLAKAGELVGLPDRIDSVRRNVRQFGAWGLAGMIRNRNDSNSLIIDPEFGAIAFDSLEIDFKDITEAAELLSTTPQPTQYDPHPEYVLWNGDVEVEPTDNAIFNDFDLTVRSTPSESGAAVLFKATVR